MTAQSRVVVVLVASIASLLALRTPARAQVSSYSVPVCNEPTRTSGEATSPRPRWALDVRLLPIAAGPGSLGDTSNGLGVFGQGEVELRHYATSGFMFGGRVAGFWGTPDASAEPASTGVGATLNGYAALHFTSYSVQHVAEGCGPSYDGYNFRSHVLAIQPTYLRWEGEGSTGVEVVYEIDDYTDILPVRGVPRVGDRHLYTGLRAGTYGWFGGGGQWYAGMAWGALGFHTSLGYYSAAGLYLLFGLDISAI